MKFDVVATQEYVDRFLEEIRRNAEIPIEDIVVKVDIFKNDKKTYTIAETCEGRIFIDPKKEFNPLGVCLEQTLLHELGHRAQYAVNPKFGRIIDFAIMGCHLNDKNIAKKIYGAAKAFFNKTYMISDGMMEGFAECFSLDMAPEFCKLSRDTILFSNWLRRVNKDLAHVQKVRGTSWHANTYNPVGSAVGYAFFYELYSLAGSEGVMHYIKNISKESVPSMRELCNPDSYWRERIIKNKNEPTIC